ncbi:MAG: ROK family protein [Alphaproteobacteria bacterium]
MAFLLADIGGTNARFRWEKKGKLGPLFCYKCDDFKSPYVLIEKALTDVPEKLEGIILAGAGPVQRGELRWTNRPKWKISEKEIQKKYHLKQVLVVNDVQAQGEGLKTLYRSLKTSILMTAGTGLGGCFIIGGQVIAGEVGQIKTERNLKIEDFVSGSGIVRLYRLFGGDKKIDSPRLIEELRKKDKKAVQAYQTFYQKWGEIAGTLATALCATGGVYLWGGLIPKNEKDKKVLLDSYQKNLPKSFVKIPLRLVRDKALSFKGLAVLSHREFGQS